jgi:hypothetical protein
LLLFLLLLVFPSALFRLVTLSGEVKKRCSSDMCEGAMASHEGAIRVGGGFDYVLVLEWLDEGKKTGAELYAFLESMGFRSMLVLCRSGEDVRAALAEAAANVRAEGVPIVHLEAHGTNPYVGNPEHIGFGGGRSRAVRWADFGPWLAPLNEACDFRLLLVSATCYGQAAMAAINHGEYAAPFAFVLGFVTDVDEGRLHDAMKELYRRLRTSDAIAECVASAARELTAGQRFELDTAVAVAVKVLRHAFYVRGPARGTRVESAERVQRARAIWAGWFPIALQERDPAYSFEVANIRG